LNQAKQAATFSIPTVDEWVLEVDGVEESLFEFYWEQGGKGIPPLRHEYMTSVGMEKMIKFPLFKGARGCILFPMST
jgi:hypothetical protein